MKAQVRGTWGWLVGVQLALGCASDGADSSEPDGAIFEDPAGSGGSSSSVDGGPSGGSLNAAGGSSGTGGEVGDGKPPASPSAGCGKALGALKSGTHTITSTNQAREYTLDVPSDYDPQKPHRLIFTWHWIDASDDAVVRGDVSGGAGGVWSYYGLKRQSELAGESALFVAPQSRHGRWDQEDHTLFNDILAQVSSELCVDQGRVFSTGFSFGAMQTFSLSVGQGKKLRAVAPIAPANYNIYIPQRSAERVAYMSSTGMSDTLTPWVNNEQQQRGAKFAALLHAERNGCAIPNVIPTTTAGSKTHVCYDFEGCDEGYPVKVCTYDGGHIAAPADGGNSDNGATTWIPGETWEFLSQF